MPSALITLPPAFLEALRKVAPKVRPRRLPYILTLGAVVAIGIASGQRILANHRGAAAPATAVADVIPAPKAVDSATLNVPGTQRPEVAATSAPADPPAAHSTKVSVDALPRATTPKATKTRHLQVPR